MTPPFRPCLFIQSVHQNGGDEDDFLHRPWESSEGRVNLEIMRKSSLENMTVYFQIKPE